MVKYFQEYFKFYLAIVLLGAVIYSNTLHAGFHFDDELTIIQNPFIKNFDRLDILWIYDPSRYLTHITFGINYHLHKLDTLGFHLVNIFFHLMNSILVFLFSLKIFQASEKIHPSSKPKELFAFLVSLVFLIHPLQTQAVTYISQRATLLATFCYLSVLLLYIKNRETGSWRTFMISLGMYFTGLFTKPIIISLPFAILLMEYFIYENPLKKRTFWIKWLIYFGLSLIVPLLLIIYKFKNFESAYILDITRETVKYTRWEYLLTQFNVITRYFFMVICPYGQNLDHDVPIAKVLWVWPTIGSFLAVGTFFSWGVYLFKRKRILSFAVFWIFLTLALESSFFPISDVMNEHRMYLPMIGVGMISAYALLLIYKQTRLFTILVLVLVTVYSSLAYRRNFVWHTKITMLEDIAKKSHQKARVFNNLGIAYFDEGRMEDAEASYKKAIAFKKDFVDPMNNLANIYFRREDYEQSKYWLEKALEINPKYSGAWYNLGNIAKAEGDVEQAEKHYIEAVNAEAGFVQAISALAKINAKRGDVERAEFFFRAAIDYNRGFVNSYTGLADLYVNQRRYAEAAAYFEKALEMGYDSPSILNSLGNVYDILGHHQRAITMYHRSIEKDPSYVNAYYNLGLSLRNIGNIQEAVKNFRAAESMYNQAGNDKMAEVSKRRVDELLQK